MTRHIVDKRRHRGKHLVENGRTARLAKHIDRAEGRATPCGDPLLDHEVIHRLIAFAGEQVHLDSDQHFIMPVEPVGDALSGQGDFRDQREIAAPDAGHPCGQRPVVELVGRAGKARRIENGVGGARGIDAGMRFNRLDNRGDDLRHHGSGFSDHGLSMGEFRSENSQVHIAAIQAISLRKIADSGADAHLIMQIVDHLVGDGVVQNPACRPDDEMILKAGIGHHRGEAVNAGTAFKSGEIERIL